MKSGRRRSRQLLLSVIIATFEVFFFKLICSLETFLLELESAGERDGSCSGNIAAIVGVGHENGITRSVAFRRLRSLLHNILLLRYK
nr:hypothetical protein Itr_chr02CG07580 [Ipomoea trifida]